MAPAHHEQLCIHICQDADSNDGDAENKDATEKLNNAIGTQASSPAAVDSTCLSENSETRKAENVENLCGTAATE